MKKSLFIFALLFTSGNIAFSQPLFEGTIPDWYTGDKSLYSTFLLSCKIARQNCPEKNIKCNNIENL
ncbi:MAG: hypothetical protein IJ638_03480, partial [Alphaproteobacteria bacterium]|nr:hypothetical protein [Alphaproteobacteria bacterium]